MSACTRINRADQPDAVTTQLDMRMSRVSDPACEYTIGIALAVDHFPRVPAAPLPTLKLDCLARTRKFYSTGTIISTSPGQLLIGGGHQAGIFSRREIP